MQRRGFLTALAATTGGALASGMLPRAAVACEIFPADGVRDFAVLHGERPVGRHRIEFRRRAGRFVVRSDLAYELSRGATGVRRFAHHGEEVWRGGWLEALVSDTDDVGRRTRVRAERRAGIFGGAVNGAAFTVSGYIIPSSLWHHDTIAVEAVLDTVDARVKLVRAHDLGEERMAVAGRAIRARHYALQGELERQLWYDEDCRLVRAALPVAAAWLTLELT